MWDFIIHALNTPYCSVTATQSLAFVLPILVVYAGVIAIMEWCSQRK